MSETSEEASMKRVLSVASMIAAGVLLAMLASASTAGAQGEKWQAPADATAMKSPVEATKESIAAGEKIVRRSCAPCHGPKGKGDGPAAAALPKKPADWTSAAVQGESEGAIFWKITTGKPPMPPWGSLPDKDRWNLVNYIKSLGAKQ